MGRARPGFLVAFWSVSAVNTILWATDGDASAWTTFIGGGVFLFAIIAAFAYADMSAWED